MKTPRYLIKSVSNKKTLNTIFKLNLHTSICLDVEREKKNPRDG